MSNVSPQGAAPAGQTFPCSNCGAQLSFDAGTQSMKCPYCGHAERPPAVHVPGAVREIPLEEGLRLAVRGLGVPVTEIACNDCGATVSVTPGEQTAKCAFCGSQQVLAREATGTHIRPESMVPFRMDKAAANARFGAWLKGLWFRPSDLKHMAQVQEMGGVYIPYWTFDALVHSRWNADAGYHYYTTESYTDGQGNRQTRQVQHTRWEPAWGSRVDRYDDVLVCASKGLPDALVRKFNTFNTSELVPYQPHLLAGWRAESYALDLLPGWSRAQETMESEQRGRCSRDVPGDTQRNLSVNSHFTERTFKHVLLPIWIAAYRYNGKPYQFLVNGQTGEVVGKAPWSVVKIVLFSLLIAALIGAGVYFYQSYQAEQEAASGDDAAEVTPAARPAAPAPKPRAPAKSAPR